MELGNFFHFLAVAYSCWRKFDAIHKVFKISTNFQAVPTVTFPVLILKSNESNIVIRGPINEERAYHNIFGGSSNELTDKYFLVQVTSSELNDNFGGPVMRRVLSMRMFAISRFLLFLIFVYSECNMCVILSDSLE